MKRVGLWLAVALVAGACVDRRGPPPPILPRFDELPAEYEIAEDEAELIRSSDEAFAEWLEEGEFLDEPSLVEYVGRVVDRLNVGPLPSVAPTVTIHIAHSLEPHATVYPNGAIVITTGLVGELDNEAQLAFVLAHELAHFVGRDSLFDARYSEMTSSTLARTTHSREKEIQADLRGVEWLMASGYRGVEALAALETIYERTAPAPVPDWDTHPGIYERRSVLLEFLRSNARTGGETGEINEEAYQQASSSALLVNAELAIQTHQLELARTALIRLLPLRPESGLARYHFGAYLSRVLPEGELDPRVLEAYEQAAMQAPDEARIQRALGLLYFRLGEVDRARSSLARYFESMPEAPDRAIIEGLLGDLESTPISTSPND